MRYIFLIFVFFLIFSNCNVYKHFKTDEISENNLKLTDIRNTKTLSEKEQEKLKIIFFKAIQDKVLGNQYLAETGFLECIDIDKANAACYYQLSDIHYNRGSLQMAMNYIENAVIIEPDNKWYQLAKANLLIDFKQYKEAAEIYSLFSNESLEYKFKMINLYMYAGEFNIALDALAEIEMDYGSSIEVSQTRIYIYKFQKKYDLAIEETKKAMAIIPDNVKIYEMLAELYLENNQETEAIEIYEEVIKMDSSNSEIYFTLARYYLNHDKIDDFFVQTQQIFKSNTVDIDTKVKMLVGFFSQAQIDSVFKKQSYQLIDILIQKHPTEAKVYSIHGDFLYQDSLYLEAAKSFEKVLEIDKTKYPIWGRLINIYWSKRDYKKVAEITSEAIEFFPNQPDIYLFNGLSFNYLKEYDSSITVLNQGLRFVFDDQTYLDFYSALADAYFYSKKYDSSFAIFEKAISLAPQNAHILNNYSYYLTLADTNLDKALLMSIKANELEPENASFQDTYGWVLYKNKDYKNAEIWIKKALNNGGNNSGTILEHYGDVMFKLGNVEKALEYWKKAKDKSDVSESIDKKIREQKVYD